MLTWAKQLGSYLHEIKEKEKSSTINTKEMHANR